MERRLEKRVDEDGNEFVMAVETRDDGRRTVEGCDREIALRQKQIAELQKDKATIQALLKKEPGA